VRPAVRDLLTGISLANLCFIAVWDEVLAVTRNRYLLDVASADVVALILNVLLLGAAFGAGATVVRRHASPWPRRLALAAFLAVLLLPLGRIVRDLDPLWVESFLARLGESPRSLRLRELAPLLPALAFAARPAASARIAQRVLLFLFPFVLITVGRGLWAVAADDLTARYADKPLAPALPPPGEGAPRLVLLILDELDQRLAFAERPSDLALPALDRLRAEAVFATQAQRPGARTAISVPAMLAGRAVDTATHVEPDELMVTFTGAPGAVPWSRTPNLFTWARARGLNTGAVGWYHPYCRVLNEMLTRCAWRPHADAISRDRAGLVARMRAQLQSLSPWDARRRHLEDFRLLLDHAKAAVTDTRLGLVLVHLNVPHNPVIFDRRRGRFTLHNGGPEGYLDNLVLADRALGELRETMEAAGLWERTALVVVSDHPRRAGRYDNRVPFLIRLPGGNSGRFDKPFATHRVGELARELLAGRVKTAADIVRWMEAR